ncbi:hypothetical protein PIB30_037891 [Stylosanthes scabra]|uniref:GRF-type domain-containing protein n=1 Tax=Stylosanthes scabra TaxID=79078 RepID=A0ABU6ZCG8_9FABA|nr:hypothetical protein [Stylosanthes scabra]
MPKIFCFSEFARVPSVLRVSGTKENPRRRFWGCVYYEVQEQCDFFCWADKEQQGEDPDKAKLRKKVQALKSEVRACERRLKIAVFVGLLGWIGLYCLWLQNYGGRTHHQWLL